jgi:hypothetical protein
MLHVVCSMASHNPELAPTIILALMLYKDEGRADRKRKGGLGCSGREVELLLKFPLVRLPIRHHSTIVR